MELCRRLIHKNVKFARKKQGAGNAQVARDEHVGGEEQTHKEEIVQVEHLATTEDQGFMEHEANREAPITKTNQPATTNDRVGVVENINGEHRPPGSKKTGKDIPAAVVEQSADPVPRVRPLNKPVDLLGDEGANAQSDLWLFTLSEKLETAKTINDPLGREFLKQATFESSLTFLTTQYTKNGFTRRIPEISNVLSTIQPFTAAITTLAQTSKVAALVWGSVQLILTSVVQFTSLFGEVKDMLTDLSRDLPRFEAYTKVLHTPLLHRALRVVYSIYIDFCFAVMKFLQAQKFYTMVKTGWAKVTRQFQKSKLELNAARKEFELEANLANVQEQERRHLEVLERIENVTTTSKSKITITNVSLGRNIMFTGREEELSLLHKILAPSFTEDEPTMMSRRTCAVHAIGGMGKTDLALEYSYRYRLCYSYIFWLNCQSYTTLVESYMAVLRRLQIYDESLTIERRIESGLGWFTSTAATWLLICDNVEEVSVLKRFWPPGLTGAIIVTSQNPDLINFCDENILLEPMSPADGSSLIQRYLRRGHSETDSAQTLSECLGGLPLAIKHYSGYVAKSQCTIDDMVKSLEERIKSSQIWTLDMSATTTGYENTLATVWDLAWRRLGNDAKKVLRMLAFLDADAVPEDMFVGTGQDPNDTGWKFWDRHRFNEAIRQLRERHLVERETTAKGVCLRTHRALQRGILHNLDNDLELRQATFTDVVAMVRCAFPEPSIAQRGDSSLWQTCDKYISQVTSLNVAFIQSMSMVSENIMFAGLLRDSGFYLMNNGEQLDAIAILKSAERVCSALIEDNNVVARGIKADAIGTLRIYYNYMGVSGRRKAKSLALQSVALRREQMANVPEDQWTQLQHINHGRSFVDLSEDSAMFEMLDDARKFIELGIKHYEKAGGEASLPTRTGYANCFKLVLTGSKEDKLYSQQRSRHYLKLIADALGSQNYFTVRAQHWVAMLAFKLGDIPEALKLHKEVMEVRARLKGKDKNDTLASRYNLAVCYQNDGDLENAELCLRTALGDSSIGVQWRQEDVSRLKFRLYLVLKAQSRPTEGTKFKKEVMLTLKEQEDSLAGSSLTEQTADREIMELLDSSVSLFHGRTTGAWSDGEYW